MHKGIFITREDFEKVAVHVISEFVRSSDEEAITPIALAKVVSDKLFGEKEQIDGRR